MEIGTAGSYQSETLGHFLVFARNGAFLGGAVDFHALDSPFYHVLDELVAEARFVGVGEDRNATCIFDKADGLLGVQSLLFYKGDATVPKVLGEGFGKIPDVFFVYQGHGDMGPPDNFPFAVGVNLLKGNVDSQTVQLLDDGLDAGNSLLCEVFHLHVQCQVGGVAEVAQNVDVLALPDGRNLDSRDNFQSDVFGGAFGQFVAVQVVVVGDRNTPEPTALAEGQQFLYRQGAVGKAGVQVQIRVAAILYLAEGTLVHQATP